jgi:cytochrome c553
MLYGSDHPESRVEGFVFEYSTPAPEAEGIPLSGPPESEGNHTAYRRGMSAWCGNCHGDYHAGSDGSAFRHAVDTILGREMIALYNRYRGTGFLDGTGQEAYTPAVPLEFAESTTGFRGPVPSGARLTCLSCHRAHASSGPAAGRWDFSIETWSEEGRRSGSYPLPNPYETTAGPEQRALCGKCHGPGPDSGAPGLRISEP